MPSLLDSGRLLLAAPRVRSGTASILCQEAIQGHEAISPNQQNGAAVEVYPLISWSDSNLRKPATCAINNSTGH
ncbi:hypothetical protein ZWY2020_037245 [Hordeum vulgare]|nr:hypothetical protein ZWY2020_037245 [Hordeum vulgare]